MIELNCMIMTEAEGHAVKTGSAEYSKLEPMPLKDGTCALPIRCAFDANHQAHHPLMATLSARMVREDEFTWYEEEE